MANQTERAELHKTIWKIANALNQKIEAIIKELGE